MTGGILYKDTCDPEFEVYIGLLSAIVCTNLSVEEAGNRLNREYPSGTPVGWVLADTEDKILQCDKKSTHKHILFFC